MVMRQGFELGRPRKIARRGHLRVAGALIIGCRPSRLSSTSASAVPAPYQPVLHRLSPPASRCVRARSIACEGAFQALAMFCRDPRRAGAVRRPGRRLHDADFRSTLAEAAVVEVARGRYALAAAGSRCQRLGIGTLGLAAEWLEPRVMPTQPASLLPQAAIPRSPRRWPAASGARMSQSLAEPGSERAALPRCPRVRWRSPRRRSRRAVRAAPAHRGATGPAPRCPHARGPREVNLAVRLDPADAAPATSGRGTLLAGSHARPHAQLTPLREIAPAATLTSAGAGDRQLEDAVRLAKGLTSWAPARLHAAFATGQAPRHPGGRALGTMVADTTCCSARRARADLG